MSKKVKRKSTFFRVIVKIVDIMIYPIMVLALFSSMFMMFAKSSSVVTPIFNHTFVRVLSPSMSRYCEEVGRSFAVNDLAFLSTDPKNVYVVGDVIAFYSDSATVSTLPKINLTYFETRMQPEKDKQGNLVYENGILKQYKNRYATVLNNDGTIKYETELHQTILDAQEGQSFYVPKNQKYYAKSAKPQLKTLQQVKDDKKIVKFHQIVQIRIDTSGTLYYLTKGTFNASTDTILVREDLVVGRYVHTPQIIMDVINFCGSAQGLIFLVIIPMSLIILVESLSILEQINNIMLEKKVIARSSHFDTKECEKAYIGLEMDDKHKIYLYDVMPPEFKSELFDFLWGCLEKSEHKKQKRIYQTSIEAIDVYDFLNSDEYFDVWENFYKSKRMKQKIRESKNRADRDKFEEVLIEEYTNYEEDYIGKKSVKPKKSKKITKPKTTAKDSTKSKSTTKKKSTSSKPSSKSASNKKVETKDLTKKTARQKAEEIIEEVLAEKDKDKKAKPKTTKSKTSTKSKTTKTPAKSTTRKTTKKE